ncbi:MAG: nucleotidyltransferase domain-containing protein [Sulfurimonas sp.]|nr:nucleotidyltransferase domain-containing protein [Sulfurimonas sp.]
MNKLDILKVLADKKELYHLKNFILFGSVAKDINSSDSDIDIAYIEDKIKLNFENYLKLESELADIFQTKIDLVNYKKFNPLVMLHAKDSFIYV